MNKKRKFWKLRVALILILALIIAFFVFTDSKLRPIITDFSKRRADITVNTIMNQKVYDLLDQDDVNYSDIASLSWRDNKVVSAIEIDTVKVNKIKAQIIGEVQKAIASQDKIMVSVPLGTVLGNEYLVGRGPTINIEMKMTAAVLSDIESTFISAGINQTLHQISLKLDTSVYIMMPWYRSSTNVRTSFVLAETVIVGTVPDAFTNVIENPGSNIAGELFDYSAEYLE
ncbi:MAG: sporulation protein YunB [Oscillospiraceae bacterium]